MEEAVQLDIVKQNTFYTLNKQPIVLFESVQEPSSMMNNNDYKRFDQILSYKCYKCKHLFLVE